MARRLRTGFVLLLLLIAAYATAQSNDTIDAILAQETATVGSAAYVALVAGELVNDETSPERAVVVAREAGWLPVGIDASNEASFGQFAYLLMRATETNGGLMYRLFPGPRYAAREFVYRRWSPERKSPTDRISGQFLIRVTGNFLENTEAAR